MCAPLHPQAKKQGPPEAPPARTGGTSRDAAPVDDTDEDEGEEGKVILILTGPEGSHRFLIVGNPLLLGRSESCDIAIGHLSVDLFHLEIAVRKDGARFTAR